MWPQTTSPETVASSYKITLYLKKISEVTAISQKNTLKSESFVSGLRRHWQSYIQTQLITTLSIFSRWPINKQPIFNYIFQILHESKTQGIYHGLTTVILLFVLDFRNGVLSRIYFIYSRRLKSETPLLNSKTTSSDR